MIFFYNFYFFLFFSVPSLSIVFFVRRVCIAMYVGCCSWAVDVF